jgi:hypothetical protein
MSRREKRAAELNYEKYGKKQTISDEMDVNEEEVNEEENTALHSTELDNMREAFSRYSSASSSTGSSQEAVEDEAGAKMVVAVSYEDPSIRIYNKDINLKKHPTIPDFLQDDAGNLYYVNGDLLKKTKEDNNYYTDSGVLFNGKTGTIIGYNYNPSALSSGFGAAVPQDFVEEVSPDFVEEVSPDFVAASSSGFEPASSSGSRVMQYPHINIQSLEFDTDVPNPASPFTELYSLDPYSEFAKQYEQISKNLYMRAQKAFQADKFKLNDVIRVFGVFKIEDGVLSSADDVPLSAGISSVFPSYKSTPSQVSGSLYEYLSNVIIDISSIGKKSEKEKAQAQAQAKAKAQAEEISKTQREQLDKHTATMNTKILEFMDTIEPKKEPQKQNLSKMGYTSTQIYALKACARSILEVKGLSDVSQPLTALQIMYQNCMKDNSSLLPNELFVSGDILASVSSMFAKLSLDDYKDNTGLKMDFSGLNFLIRSRSPNCFCFFRFQ